MDFRQRAKAIDETQTKPLAREKRVSPLARGRPQIANKHTCTQPLPLNAAFLFLPVALPASGDYTLSGRTRGKPTQPPWRLP